MRLRLFGGKGGAGKTTLAAAAALARAEAGRRVLLMSTDPAHSLGDALGRRLGPEPRHVPTPRGRLHAVELDADRALSRWLAPRRRAFRAIVLRGTVLTATEVDRLLRLEMPGADELMGLLEVSRLATDGGYDEVIVDTAPTGHALRLLAAPELFGSFAEVLGSLDATHRILRERARGAPPPDAGDRLIAELDTQARALRDRLRDPARCAVVWVTLPEILSLRETDDALAALAALGVNVERVLVNQLTPAGTRCRTCAARRRAERAALATLPSRLARRPLAAIPARSEEPLGLPHLRALGALLEAPPRLRPGRPEREPGARRAPSASPAPRAVADWLDAVAPAGARLVLVLGKGGVGKTTCAAATAIRLAARRRGPGRVLLLSTDPAHSLGDVLGHPIGDRPRRIPGAPPALRVREVDAAAGFRAWRERHQDLVAVAGGDDARAGLRIILPGDVGRQLLALAPPGLDEIWSVRALGAALFPDGGRGRYHVAVVDTAPTGHALRMLATPDHALSWVRAALTLLLRYRQIVRPGALARDLVELSRDLRRLRALLRDPRATRAVVVSRPGRLAERETARLLARLRAMRIHVAAQIVNAAPSAAGEACPHCAARGLGARRAVTAARERGRVTVVTPAMAPPPRGVGALAAWARRWSRAG